MITYCLLLHFVPDKVFLCLAISLEVLTNCPKIDGFVIEILPSGNNLVSSLVNFNSFLNCEVQ